MWNLVVISMLAVLAAVYASLGERAHWQVERAAAEDVAQSMALYRDAVIRYYAANDLRNHSVSLDELKASGLIPQWSALFSRSEESIWGNFRAADGMVYVFATRLPATDIQAELARLSRNSYLAGAYRQLDQRLVSPHYGDTGISLPELADRAVPDKAPVWIGRP